MLNKHQGFSFDSFLKEEGLLEEVEAIAIKRVIAYELEKAIKIKHLKKLDMAVQLKTSRSALECLLDPENTSITLATLVKAARFLGKELKVSFP